MRVKIKEIDKPQAFYSLNYPTTND